MALPGDTCAIHHLFKVSQILAAIPSFRTHAWALVVFVFFGVSTTLPLTVVLSFILPVAFVLLNRLLLFWCLLNFESRWQLALLNETLLEQIVHCGYLIMFVPIQALSCIVLLESVAFEISEKRRLDWDLVLTDNQPLAPADRLVRFVPWVLLYLCSRESLIWVGFENLIDKVYTLS